MVYRRLKLLRLKPVLSASRVCNSGLPDSRDHTAGCTQRTTVRICALAWPEIYSVTLIVIAHSVGCTPKYGCVRWYHYVLDINATHGAFGNPCAFDQRFQQILCASIRRPYSEQRNDTHYHHGRA